MPKRSYVSAVREDAASRTNALILAAAERLFAEKGYPATTIGDIAQAAGVSSATVHSSVGGKAKVLAALALRATTDPLIGRTVEASRRAESGAAVIGTLVSGMAVSRRTQMPAAHAVYDNRTSHPEVAEIADQDERLFRRRLRTVFGRLVELNALRPGLDLDAAIDAAHYHLSVASWRTLIRLGWSWDRTERFLTEQLGHAVLAEPGRPPAPAGPRHRP